MSQNDEILFKRFLEDLIKKQKNTSKSSLENSFLKYLRKHKKVIQNSNEIFEEIVQTLETEHKITIQPNRKKDELVDIIWKKNQRLEPQNEIVSQPSPLLTQVDISQEITPPKNSVNKLEIEVVDGKRNGPSFNEVTVNNSQEKVSTNCIFKTVFPNFTNSNENDESFVIVDESNRDKATFSAFLGAASTTSSNIPLFLNVGDPFCIPIVGVQGSGKSHTLACIVESCLLPVSEERVSNLKEPISTLVLHYDENESSVCEVAGINTPNFEKVFQLEKDKITILVAPYAYERRKRFYDAHFNVKPLLFSWSRVTADHLRIFLGVKETDNQLYVASMMELLRTYERNNMIPSFSVFKEEALKACTIKGQGEALAQRFALLESFIDESELNRTFMEIKGNLDLFETNSLLIVDLTGRSFPKSGINDIFQVLVEQFRAHSHKANKLLVLDEAHKFMDGQANDGLSNAIVNCARVMRHDALRLVISTQSPKTLAPELLELSTMCVFHKFHSPDWFSYLKQKFPFPNEEREGSISFESKMSQLKRGEAFVFATNHFIGGVEDKHMFKMKMRKRLTKDHGETKSIKSNN